MTEDAEVVVAGHICLDIIPTLPEVKGDLGELLAPGKLLAVGPAVVSTGGAVSNTGQALHRLGFRTRLMARVGDDVIGRDILEVVRRTDERLAEGISVVPGGASSYTVVINPPGRDRSFLHCPGVNDTFGADDVDCDALGAARLFHFGYPPAMRRMFADGGAGCARMFRRVKALGVTTSLDMTMPDPSSEAARVDWTTFLERVLPHVDVFAPSVEETLFMLDRRRWERSPDADGPLLSGLSECVMKMGAAIVVLKLGEEGLYLRTTPDAARLTAMGRLAPEPPDAWVGRELLVPCFEVTVAGTTGAGDATVAGFLGGMLKGLAPEACATAAVAVGAASVERPDATSGVPHWSVIQERIRAGWPRRTIDLPLPGWTVDAQRTMWSGPADAP